MDAVSAPALVKLFVICSAVLSIEMLVLAGMTAAKRSKHKGYMNPEDAKVAFAGSTLVEGADHPETARIQRAHRNLNESLPMFFGLGLICIMTTKSVLGAEICIGAFTGARVIHAVVYLNELQPWRTMMYAVGALSLVGMAVLSLLGVLT